MRRKAITDLYAARRDGEGKAWIGWTLLLIPISLLLYVLFSIPSAESEPGVHTATVFRYGKPFTVSWTSGERLQIIIGRVQKATSDRNITRLVTMSGVALHRPSQLPGEFIALDPDEHFLWPFIADGHSHPVADLHLDRPGRRISRSDSPRVLEGENFLSPEECDAIVSLGAERGLQASPLLLSEAEKPYDWSSACPCPYGSRRLGYFTYRRCCSLRMSIIS